MFLYYLLAQVCYHHLYSTLSYVYLPCTPRVSYSQTTLLSVCCFAVKCLSSSYLLVFFFRFLYLYILALNATNSVILFPPRLSFIMSVTFFSFHIKPYLYVFFNVFVKIFVTVSNVKLSMSIMLGFTLLPSFGCMYS